MWSLYRGGFQKPVVLNQRFYPKIQVSILHFHFPFPVSISTVSNCLILSVDTQHKVTKDGAKLDISMDGF